MLEADASNLITFATRWASLGDAVTEQVAQVVDDSQQATEEINPAAIELAYERLVGLNDDIDRMLGEYLERVGR